MNKQYSHYILVAVLIVAPFLYLSTFYASLPATIPTHFNIKGEADGFGSKDMAFFGPVFMGVISLFTYLLMINIKKIDPKDTSTITTPILQLSVSLLLRLCLL